MRWVKHSIFFIYNKSSNHQTLESTTWTNLFLNSPGLKVIRKERSKLIRKRARNSFLGAFSIITAITLLLVGLCYIPVEGIDKYLTYLQWFKFNDKQQAYDTISEVMGSTATIIGLSFVVIGFLFDKVNIKAQRTLEELFRATGLYAVFGISVVSIVALVIINCFKYTLSSYVVYNFAVLSSFFLVTDALAIAYLFYQLLLFFNPERVAEISSQQIIELAKFRLLDDRFTKASIGVYLNRLTSYGFEEKNQFSAFLTKGQPQPEWLELGNKNEVNLLNVHFYFLKIFKKSMEKKSEEIGFIELGLGRKIKNNQGIISISNGIKINVFERFLLKASYLTSKPVKSNNDFDSMKEQLEKRLLKSSGDGDEENVDQALNDIERLYDIYYQSNS